MDSVNRVYESHVSENTTHISQKIAQHLQSLLAPFSDEMSTADSDEDEALSASIENADILADREAIINTEELEANATTEPPPSRWKEFKSSGAKTMARRFIRRCQQLFSGGMYFPNNFFQTSF